jgi:hypothetical protein
VRRASSDPSRDGSLRGSYREQSVYGSHRDINAGIASEWDALIRTGSNRSIDIRASDRDGYVDGDDYPAPTALGAVRGTQYSVPYSWNNRGARGDVEEIPLPAAVGLGMGTWDGDPFLVTLENELRKMGYAVWRDACG